eukprot:1160206-Pelagomonas_calceolata.AAC.8
MLHLLLCLLGKWGARHFGPQFLRGILFPFIEISSGSAARTALHSFFSGISLWRAFVYIGCIPTVVTLQASMLDRGRGRVCFEAVRLHYHKAFIRAHKAFKRAHKALP